MQIYLIEHCLNFSGKHSATLKLVINVDWMNLPNIWHDHITTFEHGFS